MESSIGSAGIGPASGEIETSAGGPPSPCSAEAVREAKAAPPTRRRVATRDEDRRMYAEFTPHAGEAEPGSESIGRRAHVEHRLGVFPGAAGLAGGARREIRVADVELAGALHARAAI